MAYNKNFRSNRPSNFRANRANNSHEEYKARQAKFAEENPATVAVATLLSNNAELRRHVAKGIRRAMIKDNQLTVDDSFYVEFNNRNFAIKVNGLGSEYYYSNGIFIRAFRAAFASMAAFGQKAVDALIKECYNDDADKSLFSTKEETENVSSLAEDIIDDIEAVALAKG